jgi:hypothetical protein
MKIVNKLLIITMIMKTEDGIIIEKETTTMKDVSTEITVFIQIREKLQ